MFISKVIYECGIFATLFFSVTDYNYIIIDRLMKRTGKKEFYNNQKIYFQ